ncbi:unnamed protein product [Closterium sp. NIES-54]
MALLRVLPFDPEGRPVAFDTWHDDLQLYLLSDSRDSVSLFDHVSGAAPAPPATADVSTRSQWLSRGATARLAIRNHLPATECAHFGEHRIAQALYDAAVPRYSSPATVAFGRLLLPYLFPELSAFATVADLITHLRTSDARYRATVPAEFLPTNQPPMFITLYFIVTRLPDSLRSVRDHFLTLDPTSLTVDLLEQHLVAAETSAVAVGAARGTPRSPFFEGCSPSPLSSSFASVAAADVSVLEDVGAASTSAKHRNSKGKGGRGSGGGSGGGGGGSGRGSGGSGRGGGGGGGGGSGGGSGGGGTSGSRSGPQRGGPGGDRGQQQQRRSETQTPQQLREWLFGDDVERPRWAELLRSGVAIFDLDFDVIISAMYALSFSAEGDRYWCVPPDPGIAAAALGASVSGTPPGTAPAEALHTFTLDSGASRCFFRDSTTLTPLPAPVPVRLADPSRGPVVASSSTVLPCPAVPSGSVLGLHLPSFSTNLVSTAALQDAMVTTTTPGGQRVSICTSTRTGRHLATSGSRLLLVLPPVAPDSSLAPPSGSPLPATPSWHALPSPYLWSPQVSASPAALTCPTCLPCVKGWQRAAPHSSSFPPTTAPLQTLHMDVWGPARVSGQGHERYFLLVVDDNTRYTTDFPLRSKGEVSAVLIPWIRTVRLQLRARFGQDLPVLRLHSDRGGEFSSDLLRDFCRGEGISKSFMLPDSPQQNGIAERRIGLVMEVARTSVIHAAAPHFLWPFAGSRAFVRDTSVDKLSARAIPCVFLGFVLDVPGWQFYHPTSRRVLPSQDVTFDESVPFYRLFPYRSAPSPPPPLFLSPGPPPVDPLPPQGPAPSGVSQVDPLPGTAPVQVAVVSGAASGGAASGGAEPGGAGSEGAGSGGAEPEGVELEGAESEGAESGGDEPRGAASCGGPASASPHLSSQQLREWLVQRAHRRSGAPGAGAPGRAGAGGAAVTTGVGDPTEPGAAGAGGAGAGVAGVGGPGAGGAGAAGAGAVDLGSGGAGGTERPRPYFIPLLQQSVVSLRLVLSHLFSLLVALLARVLPLSQARTPWLSVLPLFHYVFLCLLLLSPLFLRSLTLSLTERVLDPSFESVAASALVAELLDFAAACCLDYASALVAESVPASPPSVGDPDAPDIPTPRSYAEAITGPYSSQWQVAMDAKMASWKSTGTYVDEFPPPGVNIVDGMWIFRVKRPPGSPPAFKARYVARGFNPSLFLRTDTSLPPFYVLLYADNLVFATVDTEALTLVKSELQKRHTCTDLGKLRSYLGLHITRDRARRTITLTQSHMVHQVLQCFGFQYSSPQLTPLSTSHSFSAPPSDESVEPSGPYPELVGCRMYLMTCTRPDLAYPLSLLARYVAPGRHRKVHWDAAKRVLRYLCSTSGMGLVLGGRGPLVLTGHADASWVDNSATQRSSQGYTFSLGSVSVSWRSTRSSSVLSSSYNKAMIALCQEHRLEHRTKHIALRYFLARELQQRGQLRLAYVATRANTADVFTKALPPGDHKRFVTVLGLVPTLPHLLTA